MAKPKKLQNGKWEIRPRFKDPITGEWTGKYASFTSKSAAVQWSAKIIAEAAQGKNPKGITIDWYFDHWITIYKAPFVDVKTIHRLNSDFKYFFDYFTKQKKLQDITPGQYQMFLNDLGSTHAKTTCRHAHTGIKAMFRKAIAEGFIYKNPTVDAMVTGITVTSNKQEVLNLEEFKTLMDNVFNQDYSVGQATLITHAYTGMRFGEVIGLTWDKIDFKNQTVLVSTMYDHDGTHRLKSLKGGSDPRRIHADRHFFKYMFEYRNWYKTKNIQNKVSSLDDFCFATDNGNPITNNAINKYIGIRCNEVGIKPITSHGFRRTMATLLNLAGTNIKYISSILGHKETRTTEKYYIKKTDELMKQGDQISAKFFEQNML